MLAQDDRRAAHVFFEAWNAGDLDQYDQATTDAYIAEASGSFGLMNREQNRAYLDNFFNAFPGSNFEVTHSVLGEDYVVTNWKFQGTNNGQLHTPSGNAVPATGKPVTLVGSTTWEIRDGKIDRSWTYWDLTSLLGQLGLLPPM